MKKEQQPAFPCTEKLTININDGIPHTGLAKREYIAIKAMQVILNDKQYRCQEFGAFERNAKLISKASFIMADAMITFEEKEGKE